MRDMLEGKRWSATSRLHHLGAVAMSVLLAVVLCGPAFGQQGGQQVDVSGKVTAPDGERIRGATVRIRGTTTSAVTDDQGKYSLTAPSDAVLLVNRIGYRGVGVSIGGGTSDAEGLGHAAPLLAQRGGDRGTTPKRGRI